MFTEEDKDAVEAAEEVESEETQDTEETTDTDAPVTDDDGSDNTPEDELFVVGGPITTAVESPEDTSTSESTTEDVNVSDEPVDEVDKAIFGMQKRIDKITAQKGETNAENAALKAEIAELRRSIETIKDSPTQTKRVYTDEELDRAYEKAFEDGDVNLMREIRKHDRDNIKRELETKFKPVQSQNTLTPQQQRETEHIQRQFGKYADTSINEIYPGSHAELDIMSPTSALRRMAVAKYQQDPKTYQVDGGMVQAVVDSYTDILNIRMGVTAKQKKVDETLLKNKVKKLQREKSQGSTSAMAARKDTTPRKAKTQADETKDYVAERKKVLL